MVAACSNFDNISYVILLLLHVSAKVDSHLLLCTHSHHRHHHHYRHHQIPSSSCFLAFHFFFDNLGISNSLPCTMAFVSGMILGILVGLAFMVAFVMKLNTEQEGTEHSREK